MKPSTSLGTMSNVGIVNPSPLVRQAGNIRGLLRIHEVCRMNILSSCSHVKDRCRCRVTPARCVWPVRSHTPGYVNVAPMDVTGVLFSRECPIACVRRGTWVMPSGAQGVCPIGQRRRHAVQLTLSGLYCTSTTRPMVERSTVFRGMGAAHQGHRPPRAASTLRRRLQMDGGGS